MMIAITFLAAAMLPIAAAVSWRVSRTCSIALSVATISTSYWIGAIVRGSMPWGGARWFVAWLTGCIGAIDLLATGAGVTGGGGALTAATGLPPSTTRRKPFPFGKGRCVASGTRGASGCLTGGSQGSAESNASRSIRRSHTRSATPAVKWPGRDDSAEMWDEARACYEKRIRCESAEEAIRLAVRPWPKEGWRGVEVGTTRFGRLEDKGWAPGKKWRRSATPHNLYRLMYLFRPSHVDFTDMYKNGLFGVVSPCHRFAATFYLHKYELAGAFRVEPELAKRTRPRGEIEITCGVPGSDNGVGTTDKDALRWFKMITLALHRKWMVYGGNNFDV